MRQCDGGNRSNAAVLCGALDAELQHRQLYGTPSAINRNYHHSVYHKPVYISISEA